MAQQLHWNSQENRYEAELNDGSLLVVDGDEFGEAQAERAASLSGVTDANECLPEDAEQAYADTLEVSQWEALVGVNPGVRIIKNQRASDQQYIAAVHDALMEQGRDISLSHVLDYIEHDENRPRDYAIYEVKAIKEQLAAQEYEC